MLKAKCRPLQALACWKTSIQDRYSIAPLLCRLRLIGVCQSQPGWGCCPYRHCCLSLKQSVQQFLRLPRPHPLDAAASVIWQGMSRVCRCKGHTCRHHGLVMWLQANKSHNATRLVHIDAYPAMTGASRFLELPAPWHYSKVNPSLQCQIGHEWRDVPSILPVCGSLLQPPVRFFVLILADHCRP